VGSKAVTINSYNFQGAGFEPFIVTQFSYGNLPLQIQPNEAATLMVSNANVEEYLSKLGLDGKVEVWVQAHDVLGNKYSSENPCKFDLSRKANPQKG
jgi:hypothetical protein